VRNRRIDPLALFFAVVFVGLGALGLLDVATDIDDVEPWLWSGALVVVGVAGLAASVGRSTGAGATAGAPTTEGPGPTASEEPAGDSTVDVAG